MSEKLLKCPWCDKRKFYWNDIKEVGWCHVCKEYIAGKEDFQKHFYEGVSYDPLLYAGVSHRKPLISALRSNECISYLASRFIRDERVYAKANFDPQEKRIYFPLSPLTSELGTIHISRSTDSGKKGWMTEAGVKKGGYIFTMNPTILQDPQFPIVVVEGIFDVLSPGLSRYGVALLGSKISGEQKIWLSQRDVITHWQDPDSSGLALNRELNGLGVGPLTTWRTEKDPGSYHPDSEEARKVLEVMRCYEQSYNNRRYTYKKS